MGWSNGVRVIAALMLVLSIFAGCINGDIVELDALDPGSPAGGLVWMTHTTGCGFCYGQDAPWADTLTLYDDRQLLWFSFRPDSNQQDDPLANKTGVVMAPEHEDHRSRIEEITALLQVDQIYWTERGAVMVYDVRIAAVPSDEWPDIKQRLVAWGDGLEDAPTDFNYPCDDCGGPHVQVVDDEITFGVIVPKDGHGNGNVRSGSAWGLIERQLDHLHGLMEAQPS